MVGDIIIDMENVQIQRDTSKLYQSIMIENEPMNISDPENTKFQYIADSLQIEFNHQISLTDKRNCENKNYLLLLIQWLSISNSTLTAQLLLQRNDAKWTNGKLLITSPKEEGFTSHNYEFKANLINQL